ncbi:MAG TPA: hypothetical protein VGC79_08930 [Polyangiaceae bacterium]
MKTLKYGFGLALVAGFTLTASCGGESDPGAGSGGSDSSGGKSSHAGSSSLPGTAGDSSADAGESSGGVAGAAGAAGAVEETGGAPDESGGGTSAGGKGNVGGGSSAGGTGGAMNPAGCPAAAPKDMAACTSPTSNRIRCTYPGERCTCQAQLNGGPGGDAGAGSTALSREWNCVDTLICPAAAPKDGEACGMISGACSYPGSDCTCGNSHDWNCQATLICPATKPTVGEACTTAEGTCPYGAGLGTCRCGQTEKWTCTGGNSSQCPASQPTVGSACTANSSTLCAYGSTDCACLNDKWGCN